MRFHKLDLNLLVALDVLLEERNITRAAERLHMTQSATSGVLARLRNFFEDDLLIQVGRKMQPTAYAEQLASPVREVLLKINAEITTRPTFEPTTSDRKFRIVTSDYFITIALADMIANISREAPGITFDILSPSDGAGDLLSRGEVDLLIIPDQFINFDQPSEFLLEEELSCAVWANNKHIGEALTFEQYMEMGHISVGFGLGRKLSVEDSLINEYGTSRRIEVVTHNFNTLPQLLIGTDRIVTTHKRLLQRYARYLPIKVLPTPVALPATREHMVWHRSMDNDPMLNWLKDRLRQMVQSI